MVYADNMATTRVRDEVLDVMSANAEYYGNPSSTHELGRKSKELLDTARAQVADAIHASPNEIIFTAGGTDANNLAIKGIAFDNENNGGHIITTQIEHASMLAPCRYLKSLGYDVTYLPVDKTGTIDLYELERAIRADTVLVSIMFANNEIGTKQPISDIFHVCNEYGVYLHTDAVAAIGHCDINVNDLGIDMMSISGHKLHAPKGVGALYVRGGINLVPLQHGAGQEYNLRSGTENLNSIIGFGKAIELARSDAIDYITLKSRLTDGVLSKIPNAVHNSGSRNNLDNIVSFSFENADADIILSELDAHGICASSGSAYFGPRSQCSHVLNAIGLPDNLIYGTVRFSFGIYNTLEDIDRILEVLPNAVAQSRNL